MARTAEERKAIQKAWRERNKEKLQAYFKEQRQKNKEKRLEDYRAYYAANKEKFKEYREANKEKHKARDKVYRVRTRHQKRNRTLIAKYGITLEQHNAMLLEQGNACAICRKTDWGAHGPCVDHCHTTGKVRGLLCFLCNTAIGKLKDSAVIARAAADYLEKHSPVQG